MADKKEAKKVFKPYVEGKLCPRCHAKMANHKDRLSCGKCSYTEFKHNEKENKETTT